MFCLKKETDEAAKLKNQDEVKRFYLFSFHVYHLRDVLKCSICLELYNCPVELSNCKHIFCKDCIESYTEYVDKEELICPICQKVIGGSINQHHEFFERITTFVKQALQDVNIILGSNLSKLPSYSKTIELWEKNKNSSKIFTNIKNTTMLSPLVPDISAIVKAKKVVVEANTKYVSSNKEVNKAFEVLASSPAQNPFFKQNNNKKYINNKRGKLQTFENDVTKKDILKWLQDNRNKFDAIPSTQQQIMEEIPDFELPSVSQKFIPQRRSRNVPRVKKLNVTPTTERNSFAKNKCNAHERRRTRSLECYVKLATPKLKRHSISTCPVNEAIVIEQFSSEEDAVAINSKKAAIVSILEDNCLDAIDKGILSENKLLLNHSLQIDKKPSPSSTKYESSMDTSRGWNRIKQIKKTIGHTRKKSGKLKVISRNSSANVITESNINDNRKKRRNEDLPTKILEIDEESDAKCFHLNEVETYFSNNLNKIVSRKHDQPDRDETNIKNNKIQNKGVLEDLPDTISNNNVIENVMKSDLESVLQTKEQKDMSLHESNNEIRDERSSASENVIATSQDNESVPMSKCANTHMIQSLEGEKSSKLEICENPQQLQDVYENNHFENLIDGDEIFLKATQEISYDGFSKEFLSLQEILLKEEDPKTTLNKIWEFLANGGEKNTSDKSVGVQTENTKETTTLFSNVGTQAILTQYKNVGLQTDSYDREPSTGFRISSTDMFLMQPVISSSVQTDRLICPNCKFTISGSDKNILPNASQIISGTCKKMALSGSFDNFNFETQDVMKGEEILLKGLESTRSIGINEVTKNSNEISHILNKDKKLPLCTNIHNYGNGATVGDNNKVSQETSSSRIEIKSSKRIRTVSSDNNLETDQLSQVSKKNKYMNDISVDFLSEPDGDTNCVVGNESQKLHSLNSDGIDYAEALDNIMRKCEEDESRISKSVKKQLPIDNVRIEPVPKRFKTQDIIRECEQIIKEACSTTLRIEQTQCIQEPPKPLTLLEEFNKNFNNIEEIDVDDHCKSINETKKKFSESLFTSTENLKTCKDQSLTTTENVSSNNINKNSVDDFINRFKQIDDSFEEDYNAEVESITESMLKSDDQPQKVNIISNIVLKPKNVEEVNTNTDCNRGFNSPEIFDSDQEIIETTPQKHRPTSFEAVSLLSQVSYNPKVKKKLSLDNELIDDTLLDHMSCFNKTFTPPPEFQDCIDNIGTENENNDKKEKEDKPQLSFLMSNTLENDVLNVRSKHNDFFITSTPFPNTSQVLSSRSLNISPIHTSDKQMNPILAVQNASKLPLIITRSKTPPRQKITPLSASTPKQKSILNYVKPGDNLNTSLDKTSFSQFSQSSFTKFVNVKPNVACTRMNKIELLTITSLANKKIITFTTTFSSMVTHMIVAVDKRNYLRDHTMKFVSAVAAGIWVVNIKWIEECLKQNKVVSEEPYEVLDISGVDGPRRSRLNRSQNPLLSNYVIHAAPPFMSTTQKEVENVITLLGGTVVQRSDDLLRNKGKICLIITESNGSQPDTIYEAWLETLRVVTVDLEWLTRSVGKFEIQSLRPFALCCEESIGELSYPSALLEDVPLSHSTLT